MAESPEHADTIFDQHADAIDILITDVIMPGATGPALFQRLAKIRSSLKVMYMSGYTDDAIAHGGRLDPDVAFPVEALFRGRVDAQSARGTQRRDQVRLKADTTSASNPHGVIASPRCEAHPDRSVEAVG
jgi:CheY-like chemotaxis protein